MSSPLLNTHPLFIAASGAIHVGLLGPAHLGLLGPAHLGLLADRNPDTLVEIVLVGSVVGSIFDRREVACMFRPNSFGVDRRMRYYGPVMWVHTDSIAGMVLELNSSCAGLLYLLRHP